ncbi:ComEC/Rec2 family competence protein [Oscillatoria sp. HE19RPO]|uniref:ComEC/Rec2 family competence protein n=1 Tax=Oscillatoria sp. HE19RPO TaxID=2954806 RepID=UPI0020C515FD|nr:hypothetical protein [Oscillatoria sp. HE19RPO]
MICELAFLAVGNADSIVILPADSSVVVIDLPQPRGLLKFLTDREATEISRIYITHEHRDHFPTLEGLVKFLDNWFKEGRKVRELCLPFEVYKKAREKLGINPDKNPRLERLRHTLLRLRDWEKKGSLTFLESTRNSNPYSEEGLEIQVLHPGLLYAQDHLASINGKDNEISAILRVTYGNFAALLLADIEGDGLKELLTTGKTEEFKADLVKIPHHGAWPKNGDDLQSLLKAIDAEIAVLSVGSNNPFGHVVPELFSLLLSLKDDSSHRLSQFVCTEVTRTCFYSASKRAEMGKKPELEKSKLCAGDITIVAETSGKWTLKTQNQHEEIISKFPYAACKGRTDLGSLGI